METRTWSLERMTAFLKRIPICLTCGSRYMYYGECIECIVAYDKRVNWPMIQAELDAKAGR